MNITYRVITAVPWNIYTSLCNPLRRHSKHFLHIRCLGNVTKHSPSTIADGFKKPLNPIRLSNLINNSSIQVKITDTTSSKTTRKIFTYPSRDIVLLWKQNLVKAFTQQC